MALHFEAQTSRGKTVRVTIVENTIVAVIRHETLGKPWERWEAHEVGVSSQFESFARHPSVTVAWDEKPDVDLDGEEIDNPLQRVIVYHAEEGLQYTWGLRSDMFSGWKKVNLVPLTEPPDTHSDYSDGLPTSARSEIAGEYVYLMAKDMI